ncbi:MAG: hypothetical protein AB7O37_01965 [Vicinamibacteria bacterium]
MSAGPGNRRRFLRGVLAAPLVPGALAEAQAPPAAAPSPAAQASPLPSPSASPETKPDPVADAILAVARARFGAHVESDEEWARIRRDVTANLRNAERFRALKLTHADEPVTAFSARVPGRELPAAAARRPAPRRRR